MSKKRQYSETYLDYGFTFLIKNGEQVPQWVTCQKTMANSCMKPYQLKQHLVRNHPELENKDRKFFKTKEDHLKRARLDATGKFQKQTNVIVKASYEVAYKIAKEKKGHNIGEMLIKPCILMCTQTVLGDTTHQKMQHLSLSNDTICSRINDIADNIKEQLLTKICTSPYFAIQLDESTDVSNLSQLLVFVRYLNEGKIEEDFLFCQPLQTTTKAEDVFKLCTNFFEENNLKWESLVGICTDGAPAMLGSRSELVTLIKQKNSMVQSTHCVIHREALASKTLPKNLNDNLSVVIKVVNYIKGSALNTRLFRQLCEEIEAAHDSLLFHTQVRWLSKGNMLRRVFELYAEIGQFLEQQGKVSLLEAFRENEFQIRLAYLTDIFGELNDLNRKFQGKGHNVLTQSEKIKAFVGKLQLWMRRVERGNFASFASLSDCVGDAELPRRVHEEIGEHLIALQGEFARYFPGINAERVESTLVHDPCRGSVDKAPEELQEELVEIQNDFASKDQFKFVDLEEFWISMQTPRLAKNALIVLTQFSSTYLCEAGFSALLHVKTKFRNHLNVEPDLRCALSSTIPDILYHLAAQKQCQKSHL